MQKPVARGENATMRETGAPGRHVVGFGVCRQKRRTIIADETWDLAAPGIQRFGGLVTPIEAQVIHVLRNFKLASVST